MRLIQTSLDIFVVKQWNSAIKLESDYGSLTHHHLSHVLFLRSNSTVSGTRALRNLDHTLLWGVRLPADSAEMLPIDVAVAR